MEHAQTPGDLPGEPRIGEGDGGPDFAILIAGTYRCLADALVEGLSAAGFPEVRPQDGYIFRALAHESLNSADLARRLGVSKQATLKIVDDLEARGFVSRQPGGTDRREKILRLTERGQAARATALQISHAMEAELAAALGPDQVASTHRVLAAFIARHGELDAFLARRARPVW